MASKIKRVGVLTGGGDAPGLNPAIKGLVYRGSELGLSVIGLFDGWRGLLDPLADFMPLDRETVSRWDRDGGTNLGSSRTNPFKIASEAQSVDRSDETIKNISKLGLDALVVCGGEDTLGVAARLAQKGVRVVGVPKTIDKDLAGTDYTLGFDTALRNVTEVIERSLDLRAQRLSFDIDIARPAALDVVGDLPPVPARHLLGSLPSLDHRRPFSTAWRPPLRCRTETAAEPSLRAVPR